MPPYTLPGGSAGLRNRIISSISYFDAYGTFTRVADRYKRYESLVLDTTDNVLSHEWPVVVYIADEKEIVRNRDVYIATSRCISLLFILEPERHSYSYQLDYLSEHMYKYDQIVLNLTAELRSSIRLARHRMKSSGVRSQTAIVPELRDALAEIYNSYLQLICLLVSLDNGFKLFQDSEFLIRESVQLAHVKYVFEMSELDSVNSSSDITLSWIEFADRIGIGDSVPIQLFAFNLKKWQAGRAKYKYEWLKEKWLLLLDLLESQLDPKS